MDRVRRAGCDYDGSLSPAIAALLLRVLRTRQIVTVHHCGNRIRVQRAAQFMKLMGLLPLKKMHPPPNGRISRARAWCVVAHQTRQRMVWGGAVWKTRTIVIAACAGIVVHPCDSESRLAAQNDKNAAGQPVGKPAGAAARPPERNPDRNAYFGETHVHTSWSFDAFIFGNTRAGPEDAYKFALGQPIDHPAGYKVKITRPLDFMAVTDHAEYAGVVPLANDPNSPVGKLPIAEKLKVRNKEDMQHVYLFLGTSMIKNEPIPELNLCPRWRATSGSKWSASRTSIISQESLRLSPPMSGVPRLTIATCTETSSSKIPARCRTFRSVLWTPITLKTSGTPD